MKNLVLCALLFSGINLLYAQKWDASLQKIDAAYEIGDYEKAKKGLDKFSKKVSKKLGKENEYTAAVFIREANFTLALGQLQGFDGFLQSAEASSRVLYGENSANYISTLIQIAEAWNKYGYPTKAKIHLDKALAVYKSMKMDDGILLTRLDLITAETLIHMGFNNEALTLLNKHEDFLIGRAVDRESSIDESGKLKTVRLSEEEVKSRYHTYAQFLTLRADAYANKGNRDSTTYAYDYAASYITRNRKYLGEQSTPYIINQLNYINYFIENGARYSNLPKDLKYETILNYLKTQHKTTHYLAFPLYEGIMKQLLIDGSRAKFANVKAEYEKNIKSTFKKSSLYSVNLRAIEFQTKMAKERTRTLENEAATIIIQQAVPRFHPKTVDILDFLIDLSIRENRFLNAEGYITDVMNIKEEVYGINSPEYHLSKIKLANFYLDFTNKIEEAGNIYETSYFKIVEPQIHPFHKNNLEILNHLAVYYDDLDKYEDAQLTLKKLADISRTKFDNQDPEYAIALEKIAGFRIELGDYEEAAKDLASASAILNVRRLSEEYLPAQIKTMETQARLYALQALFDEAETLLANSRKISSKASGLAMTNDFASREQLSNLLIYLGRYTEPEKILSTLINEYESLFGSDSRRLVAPLLDQGRLYLLKGDYSKAEQVALRANKIALNLYGEKSTKTAPTQKLLADIYYSFGDYDNSKSNLIKALEIQEARLGRNHIEVAKSLSQLALNMFYDGDDKVEIEKMMVEARDIIATKVGISNPQYADIMKNLAVLYISQKKYEQAFSALTTAENIWLLKAGRKNNINTASIYVLTGDVYYQLRNFKKADEFYNKAKSLYEKNFSKQHPEYVKVLSKLSRVYYMEGDSRNSRRYIEEALANYEGFIKLYFPALSEREKAKYWNTIKGDFEFYNTIAFSQPDAKDLLGKVYDYQLLTKALLLSSSIKIRERILSSTDEDLKEKYNLWIEKKEFLTAALSMSTAQLAEDGINPASLQTEIEKIEKELSAKSEFFGQDFENKKISWTDVRKSLNPNEVAIEMVRFRYFNHSFTDSVIYAALYVKNEKTEPTPRVIMLGNGKLLEARNFIFYRNAIMREFPDNISYAAYWQPIQEQIGQVSTIYLSADGVYNQINLEAIPTPDGRYILDNSNIVLVSNTKDIYINKIKTRASSKNNLAMMFGDPLFYVADAKDKVLPLPGTQKEVIELNTLLNSNGWKTEYYLQDKATEDIIKEIQSPKIFHIATHGMYVPSKEFTLEDEIAGNESLAGQNPLLRNGLLLKGAGDILEQTEYNFNLQNGILTAYEAMSLNLDQTDLVVLSACETGLGDVEQGEGVYGLQRAFLVAGAKTLIMSMFKVDDTATQKLMVKFYRNWLSTGNQRQSFIDAKKELRLEYPEPIYWGAFIMIGME
jgi:CHAT domain-containing protein